MQDNSHEEHFVGRMKELPGFQVDCEPNCGEQNKELDNGGDNEDGKDVELIGRKVIVEQVALLPIGHQEFVAEMQLELEQWWSTFGDFFSHCRLTSFSILGLNCSWRLRQTTTCLWPC